MAKPVPRTRFALILMGFVLLVCATAFGAWLTSHTTIELDCNSARHRWRQVALGLPLKTTIKDTWITQHLSSDLVPDWRHAGTRNSSGRGGHGSLEYVIYEIGYLENPHRTNLLTADVQAALAKRLGIELRRDARPHEIQAVFVAARERLFTRLERDPAPLRTEEIDQLFDPLNMEHNP